MSARAWTIAGLSACLAPTLRRFRSQLDAPLASQHGLLRQLIASCARTAYGRHHQLAPDDSCATFRSKMPISTPATLAAWNAQPGGDVAAGSGLVSGGVRFWEQTSGSTGDPRSVPYTPGLIGVCTRLFTLWTADLLRHGPALASGRLFLSVSPRLDGRPGADSDTAFLSGAWQAALRPFLIIPPRIRAVRDPIAFRHLLALYLLAGDPEIISIWNPAFLQVLMDHVEEFRMRVRQDLLRGEVQVGGTCWRLPRACLARARQLATSPVSWPALLPSLRIISCWRSAQAGPGAERLAGRFPHCLVQGKGLLATEAPMTVPLLEAQGCVPLVEDVFYEFEDASGGLHLIDDLQVGREYQLIITPRGGYCRYRIGDVVRVTHRYRQTPCLEFSGRVRSTDLAGEKLHEGFVALALARVGGDAQARTLIPVIPDQGPAYYVLATTRSTTPDQARGLDEALMAALRYREARMLGQLGAVQVLVVPQLERVLLDAAHARGMAWGDCKPSALYPWALNEARLQEWAHAC